MPSRDRALVHALTAPFLLALLTAGISAQTASPTLHGTAHAVGRPGPARELHQPVGSGNAVRAARRIRRPATRGHSR